LLSKGENGTGNFRTVNNRANEFYADSAAKWCFGPFNNCININLNAYAGLNNIKLKFEGYNNYNNDLYIDNVNIDGTALLPIANFYSSKKTACVGESISYFDSTINIATSWKWTFTGANATSSTVQNPTGIIYTTPGTYAVKLVVSNSTGSDSITKTTYITVVANPNKPTVTSSKPFTFCQGDSITLNSDVVGTAYQWMVNGSKVGGAFAQNLVVTTTGNYGVMVYNASGCATSSDSVIVTVNTYPPKPVVSSNLSSNFMCTGGTATFTSSANTGNQWYKNGVAITGSTSNIYNTTDSGSYTVQVNNSGCLSQFSDSKDIVLLPLPATSAITGNDAPIRTRTEAYSVTSRVGSTYTWTISNGTKTSGGTTAAIQVLWTTAGATTVKVQESASNGCKGATQTKTINVIDNVGIGEVNAIRQLSVYPNPASQQVLVRFESTTQQPMKIRVVNVLGQTVIENDMQTKVGSNEKLLVIEQLRQGVYFIELDNGNEKVSRRLMVQ
jgi:trimeric autotransporter adhesin